MKTENWIKWDLNSRSGSRMAAFFSEHGAIGYGFFMVLTETFYRSEGNKVAIEEMQTYAKLCKLMQTDAKIYIDTLVELRLWERDETHFWSPRVVAEESARREKRELVSAARKKAAEAKWRKMIELVGAKGMQTDDRTCKRMQTGIEREREGEREIDIEKENFIYNNPISKKPKFNKYKSFKVEDFVIPVTWGASEIEALDEWVSYKTKLGCPAILETYKKQVKQFAADGALFCRLVARAINKGWRGLNEELPFTQSKGMTAKGTSASFEYNARERERLLQEEKEGKI